MPGTRRHLLRPPGAERRVRAARGSVDPGRIRAPLQIAAEAACRRTRGRPRNHHPSGLVCRHSFIHACSGRGYAMAEIYAYENRPHRRVTIHLAECRECLHGQGKRGAGSTENGSWSGAYASVNQAVTAVSSRQPLVRRCKVCLGGR
jgi:hypothetical protein